MMRMRVNNNIHRALLPLVHVVVVIFFLGIISVVSADGGAQQQQQQHAAVHYCDERIRELETNFEKQLFQSTKAGDESCRMKLQELDHSIKAGMGDEVHNLQTRLAETQTLLEQTQLEHQQATDRRNALETELQQTQSQLEEAASSSSNNSKDCDEELEDCDQELKEKEQTLQQLEKDRDACHASSQTLQQRMDEVQSRHLRDAEARVTAAVTRTRTEIQEEHAKKLKLVQDGRNALAEENAELKATLKQTKAQLQQTKTDLFDLRQELFATNEKLREATRGWHEILLPVAVVEWCHETQAYVVDETKSLWKHTIVPAHQDAQARALPYLEKAGIPGAWQKLKAHARPLMGMLWSVITTICQEAWTLVQTLRREVPIYWKEFCTVAQPKVQHAWQVVQEHAGRAWAQVREVSQPLVDKLPWEKMEPYIEIMQGLWRDLVKDTAYIRAEIYDYAVQARDILLQGLEKAHDLAIACFHQGAKSLHLLLKMYEAPAHIVDWTKDLHVHSHDVIWYLEALLGTYLALFVIPRMLGFGGRNKQSKTLKQQPGGGSPKKQRIPKRQTVKTEKNKPKKHVSFGQ